MTLKAHKDGRLIVEIERKKETKSRMEGWDDKKGKYVKIFKVKADPKEDDELDFNEFDKHHPRRGDGRRRARRLGDEERKGMGPATVRQRQDGPAKPGAPEDRGRAIMGAAVARGWRLVNLPFREEYPGGRQWNFDAAQFKFKPAELADDEVPCHPHWDMIFDHIGHELTPVLRELPWAIDANIRTGADYLRAWVACAFRDPFQPSRISSSSARKTAARASSMSPCNG